MNADEYIKKYRGVLANALTDSRDRTKDILAGGRTWNVTAVGRAMMEERAKTLEEAFHELVNVGVTS